MDAPPPTRPWIADDSGGNDKDQSFASGMAETWLRSLAMLPDEHTCFAFRILRIGLHRIMSGLSANRY